MKKVLFVTSGGFIFLLSLTSLSFAETTMSPEGQYIFNSLGFYLGGVLVAFMYLHIRAKTPRSHLAMQLLRL